MHLTVPTAHDVAALSGALPTTVAVVPYLAAGLGLRAGELFGLQVADIDFLRRSVTLMRQLDERGQLVPLKTYRCNGLCHCPPLLASA